MKGLWIGVGVGPKLLQEMQEKNERILSAQVSQGNLIDGLDALGICLDTLNAPKLDYRMFPQVQAEQWSRREGVTDKSVSYSNTIYGRVLNKQKALCAAARQWAQENLREKDIVVFVYSMHSPFMAAACEVKKWLPHAKICLIVPDLPQYMDLQMSRIKKALKKLDWYRMLRYMKKIDKYILYAQPMAKFLRLKEGSWMVMEGSYDSDLRADSACQPSQEKISVMYSGVLDKRYGIPELMDAMQLLDDRYELWLTGGGKDVPMVQERAAQDDRVKFFGYLPSRQDLLNKQAQATMLISPRRDIEEASKYCFPSKLFEYMVAGRPVISCFLAGIPEQYHPYLFELTNATAEEIAHTISQVGAMSEEDRKKAGNQAKDFVLTHKNKFVQARNMAVFAGLITQ